MNNKGQHAKRQVGEDSLFPCCHAESLPNTSAVFSVAALADRDDVVAVARTAALLARSSGASLSVTVLGECVMSLQGGEQAPRSSLETSLSSIRTKLFASRSTARSPTLTDSDPAPAILEFAMQRGITQIFVGRSSAPPDLWTRMRGDLIVRLIRAAEGIDVVVYPNR